MRLLLAACHVAVSKTTARNDRLKRLFRAGLFSAILSASSAHAQTDTPCPTGLTAETACYSGKDENGAFYLIAKPKNWNGMLVVHAHGGPNPFGDEKLSTSIEYLQRFSVVVQEGYAWAGSSYRRGGFGVRMAAEDSENVRRIFVQAFGQPKRTIIHGQSYGGAVAAKIAELYAVNPDGSRNYDAALLTSGLVAGGTRSYLFRADLRAVYQYYCKNHPRADEVQYPLWMGLPVDSKLTRADLESRVNECTGVKLPLSQRSEQQRKNLDNILGVIRIPERTLLTNVAAATFGFQDMVQRRLGGRNPFSNVGVQYAGSTDDETLNRDVTRFQSDPQALAELAFDSDPTGAVPIPVLTMHAVDDPVLPVEVDFIYREILEKTGAADHLVQTFTDEHVHPKLSTPQYAALLAALREWIETGRKPSPESISDTCSGFSAVYGEMCLFATAYQPKSFWSRVYPRTE
jgi:pimeloyl-ACP methyl ester carboxylesterase